jgi:hypothetical protein
MAELIGHQFPIHPERFHRNRQARYIWCVPFSSGKLAACDKQVASKVVARSLATSGQIGFRASGRAGWPSLNLRENTA